MFIYTNIIENQKLIESLLSNYEKKSESDRLIIIHAPKISKIINLRRYGTVIFAIEKHHQGVITTEKYLKSINDFIKGIEEECFSSSERYKSVCVVACVKDELEWKELFMNLSATSFILSYSRLNYENLHKFICSLKNHIYIPKNINKLNPYYWDGPCTDNMFFGRQNVLELVEKRAWKSFAIVGPRRIGKTSLLYALRKRIALYSGQTFILINCRGVSNFSNFFELLLSNLVADSRYIYENKDYKSLSKLIRGSARKLGTRYVLAIDDFDKIASSQDPWVVKIINMFNDTSLHGRCRFIVTGYSYFWKELTDSHSEYYNLFQLFELGPFEKKEAEEFVSTTLSEFYNIVPKSNEAIDMLVYLSGGLPWLLQAMCSELLTKSINVNSLNSHQLFTIFNNSDIVQEAVLDFAIMNCSDLGNLILSYLSENIGNGEQEIWNSLIKEDIFVNYQDLLRELKLLIMSGALCKDQKGYYLTSDILRIFILSSWKYDEQLKYFKKATEKKDNNMPEQDKRLGENVFNITNIGRDAVSSQFQSGVSMSTQSNKESVQPENLKSFLFSLRNQLDKLDLKEDEFSEVDADIKCIDAQLLSANPKKSIINESLISIRNILEGFTGSIIASGLIEQLKIFI